MTSDVAELPNNSVIILILLSKIIKKLIVGDNLLMHVIIDRAQELDVSRIGACHRSEVMIIVINGLNNI
jgi:hypothetical protein